MSDQKETIYIDIDDEITSIIDKVTTSKKKVVALVLPKRATVMQSVVNMRLLKRASEEASKSFVLITSEASVLPLAGAVGVYTAKTLQSKPTIPDGDETEEAEEEIGEEEPDVDNAKTVGELAGVAAVAAVVDEDETIEVDNETKEDGSDDTESNSDKSKNKKLKIPNFDSFRNKLFLGIGIVLLLAIGWYVAFYVMPKATIAIKTNATTNSVDITFVADPKVSDLDKENKIVPAKVQKLDKTKTEKSSTTGEKNLGEKATGKATMKLTTDCITPLTDVPAGTTISSGNQGFITQKKASFTPPPAPDGNGNCIFTSNEVGVTAAAGGGEYNLSGRVYTVAGFGSVVANGSNMSGGTDKIVKIVNQQDVDGAKNKALEGNVDEVKAELSKSLEAEGYLPIPETFNNTEPVITSTPNVGDEANEVSVTVVTSYSMVGAKNDDLKTVVDEEAKKTIDTNNQSITDYGLDAAVYQVYEVKPDGETRINFKTNITTGTQLNADQIKEQSAGKKRGEVQEQIKSVSGVVDVEVIYKPFWVTKTTKNVNKITVIIENEGN